jgi:cytochrome b561
VLVQSILLLQPTSTQKQKVQGTYIHSGLNVIAMGLLIAGLVVIEMNKASHPETRFQSTHGKVALLVYILLLLQFLIGVAQFYTPKVFGSVDNAKSLYKYHRASGYLIVILSVVAICLATQTGFNANVLHIRLWATIVASVLLVVGLLPRIKKHKLGL